MKLPRVTALLAVIIAGGIFASPVSAGEPPREPAVAKPSFVPFDFYPRHRDELGLSDEQLREMQRLADQMRDSTQSLEEQRRERTKVLQEAMAQDSIDPRKAMELFDAVLK